MERKAAEALVEDSATLLTTVKQQLKPDWNHAQASRRGCENLAEVSAEVGDWPPQTVIVSWCTSFAENLPGWLLDMDVKYLSPCKHTRETMSVRASLHGSFWDATNRESALFSQEEDT